MIDKVADGRTDLVLEFLEAGNEAVSKDKRGVRLIRHCAYFGDVTAIKLLLENGESLDSLEENFNRMAPVFTRIGNWSGF